MLYDWNIRLLYEQLVGDADELNVLVRDVITVAWHDQHDAGRPFAETSAELTALHPRFADAIAAFGPRFNETIAPMRPAMEAIVRTLRARGVPLYAITNFSDEFWHPFRARESAIFDLFDDIVVSGREKLTKPDPAIYLLALDRFGLAPQDAIFIDDREDNVRAAEALGIRGHHFRNVEALAEELRELGLL